MKKSLLFASLLLSLATLAGCDRAKNTPADKSDATGASAKASAEAMSHGTSDGVGEVTTQPPARPGSAVNPLSVAPTVAGQGQAAATAAMAKGAAVTPTPAQK